MNNERKDLLSLTTLPARLSTDEAANYLGFQRDHIAILVKAGLLKPLGQPKPNCEKYFATVKLMELRQDAQWLSRATAALSQQWKEKNARKNRDRNGDEPRRAASAETSARS